MRIFFSTIFGKKIPKLIIQTLTFKLRLVCVNIKHIKIFFSKICINYVANYNSFSKTTWIFLEVLPIENLIFFISQTLDFEVKQKA